MTTICSFGTYLPAWGTDAARQLGVDEDAVTLAVAAGLAAIAGARDVVVRRVVLISHDLPLLDGGNGAVLLAALGLPDHLPVVEQIGGAPAVLDAVTEAGPGTLIVAADGAPAGAAACLTGGVGLDVTAVRRHVGSLPVRSRGLDGVVRDYDDTRLAWDRGGRRAINALELAEKPVAVAGVTVRQAAGLAQGPPPVMPTTGGSAALFALAAVGELGAAGLVLGVEQASATAVRVGVGRTTPAIRRDERAARPALNLRVTPGPEIAISLAAYGRAFEPKVRWEAGRCDACGTLALPPRHRCLGCGSEKGWSLTPLPRTGAVYTVVTVHVPVPGVPTPYSLAIVELDDVEVRSLVKITGAEPGSTAIGDRGQLVLRRGAVRAGIPDYGYALLPQQTAGQDLEAIR